MRGFGVGGVSPLWHAGFTGNPFRTLTEEEWEELALVGSSIVETFFREPWVHLQVLGDAGAGKSSLLRGLCREARRHGQTAFFEYIPCDADNFHCAVPPGSVFCLDEAQRLNHSERARLLAMVRKQNVRLCLGTHEDLAPLLNQGGLTVRSLKLGERDAAEYAAIWNHRLSRFARPGVPHAYLAPDALTYLQTRFAADLRGAERFLYRYFQTNVNAPREITEADLAGA